MSEAYNASFPPLDRGLGGAAAGGGTVAGVNYADVAGMAVPGSGTGASNPSQLQSRLGNLDNAKTHLLAAIDKQREALILEEEANKNKEAAATALRQASLMLKKTASPCSSPAPAQASLSLGADPSSLLAQQANGNRSSFNSPSNSFSFKPGPGTAVGGASAPEGPTLHRLGAGGVSYGKPTRRQHRGQGGQGGQLSANEAWKNQLRHAPLYTGYSTVKLTTPKKTRVPEMAYAKLVVKAGECGEGLAHSYSKYLPADDINVSMMHFLKWEDADAFCAYVIGEQEKKTCVFSAELLTPPPNISAPRHTYAEYVPDADGFKPAAALNKKQRRQLQRAAKSVVRTALAKHTQNGPEGPTGGTPVGDNASTREEKAEETEASSGATQGPQVSKKTVGGGDDDYGEEGEGNPEYIFAS